MRTKALVLAGAAAVLAWTPAAFAKATPDELARLGADLTPFGAEKAGNKDGTIPAWEGGLTKPPAGYKTGMHHPDPFAEDKVLFTITAANLEQYKDKLSPGHQALLKTYDGYKLNVYPTRRSAAAPERIYAATKKIAATAELVGGGDGVKGAVGGIPFPVPKDGLEVIWNHLLRYRSDRAARYIGQAAVTRGGDYTLVQFEDEFNTVYSQEGMTEA
ncbi:MAG: DUF1329 domain-containing protein, partial [Deferrisomatales bacterium]